MKITILVLSVLLVISATVITSMAENSRDDQTSTYTFTGQEEHKITHDEAQAYIDRFRATTGNGDILGGYFGEGIFEDILDQEKAVGLRYYYGLNESGLPVLVLVGVDSKGNDITTGVWGQDSWLCPPFCPGESPSSELASK